MGRLERHLDQDLIARLKAGIRFAPEPIRHKKQPRSGASYRSAIRNAIKMRRRAYLEEKWRLDAIARKMDKLIYADPDPSTTGSGLEALVS